MLSRCSTHGTVGLYQSPHQFQGIMLCQDTQTMQYIRLNIWLGRSCLCSAWGSVVSALPSVSLPSLSEFLCYVVNRGFIASGVGRDKNEVIVGGPAAAAALCFRARPPWFGAPAASPTPTQVNPLITHTTSSYPMLSFDRHGR